MTDTPHYSGYTPPRMWEALLRRLLPLGPVGQSILGDLREEHGLRAKKDPARADSWYRREALSISLRALRDRILGRWAVEPRLAPRSGRGESGDPPGARLVKALLYSLRALGKAPRFTSIAIFTLALGIGSVSGIFSLVNGVLLDPLPYPDSHELVRIRGTLPGMGIEGSPLSADYYFRYRENSSAFSEMGFYRRLQASLTGEGDPESVSAVRTSHTLFRTLRVSPLLGRTFTPEEDGPNGTSPVAIIGHGLWKRRFGEDPDILGRTLQLNGETREIIGVMRPGFLFPEDAEIWIPAGMDAENASWSFSFPTVGRLAPGISTEQAVAQLTSVVESIRDSYPEGSSWHSLMVDGQYAPVVEGMKEGMVRSMREPLWILLGTVGLVLLIACTNVANLVLVRSEERQRQTAVRAALGATRGSLVRQSLLESGLLALFGGGAGLLLVRLILPVILAKAPPSLPRLDNVAVDQHVLLFTLGTTVLATLIFGVPPLVRLSSPTLFRSLKQGGERATSGPGRGRYRSLLVAAQAALALVLMVGSGLMVRSFWRVYQTDLGFEYENLLTFRVTAPTSRYDTPEAVTIFHEEVLERLRSLPGVGWAALTNSLPLDGATGASPFNVEGDRSEEGRAGVLLDYKRVSEGYVEAMGIPVLAGETLTRSDTRSEHHRVMVNNAFVSRFWPGESAVGKRVRFPAGREDREWYTVTGVVETVLNAGVMVEARPLVYFPLMNPAEGIGWSVPSATYVLRGPALPELARAIHEAVWSIDPGIPLVDLRTGEEIVADSVIHLSFTMVTLGTAAVLALILGVVGLFGVLSYSVAQRTREIAVHMAMGARRREVMGMVVRDGARITLIGTLLGLVGAWGLTRVLQGFLYGVTALDPLTFGGMAALLMGVALLAAYLPARKAASVDPAESMRAE